jgi:hypothetical protein
LKAGTSAAAADQQVQTCVSSDDLQLLLEAQMLLTLHIVMSCNIFQKNYGNG